MNTSFIETARACLANGERLLCDAKLLSDPEQWFFEDADVPWKPTSLALAILAEEEFAKGFLLFLVGQGVLPWSSAIRRAARDHSCKHLLSELMEYADPDIEEVEASIARSHAVMKLLDEMPSLSEANHAFPRVLAVIKRQNELWREINRIDEEQEAAHGFSPLVAAAINILRHKKVGYWECGYAYDDEKYDHAAEAIAEGLRDREKQRALYIGVSKDGTVSSRPDEVKKEAVTLAVEHAKKLGEFLSRLLERGGGGIRFDRLIENLKVMFASEEELRIVFSKG